MSNTFHDDFSPVDVVEVYRKSKMLAVDKMEVDAVVDALKELGSVKEGGKSGTLLDVGCGYGVATSLLAKYFDQIIGVDPSPGQIMKAKEIGHPGNIRFEISPAENLPVADGSIDVITVIMAFHFIDVATFVKECRRVLKPGGVAIIFKMYPSKLTSLADENAPPIVDEIEELIRKSSPIATATSHPERYLFDHVEAQFNAIEWPGKRKVDFTTHIVTNLGAMRHYYLSIPFYSKIGTVPGDHMIKVFDAARKTWKVGNLDDAEIPIKAFFDSTMIILK